MSDPVYEVLVPQTGGIQAWSFPARSQEDAARYAANWCLRNGWMDVESTQWGDSVEFALKPPGAEEWTWYEAQARFITAWNISRTVANSGQSLCILGQARDSQSRLSRANFARNCPLAVRS